MKDSILKTPNIVIQAATDYCMEVEDVQKIYDEFYDQDRFYEQLELFIKNRAEDDYST